jgi:parvulin-like peptidyl-prolyl isomerase
MVQAQQKLKDGAEFAEVAQSMSDCPSKTNGGDLEFFGRVGMDLHFTVASFGLKDGEVSKPVQTTFGYHLIKRTGFRKGADANGDQVRASHILAMYANDQMAVRAVQQKVNSGNVDVAFVSDDYRRLAPSMFR